ncbi:MAG: protein-L-isoaspartate(D-aspartate) O-methyltransferase [Parcubacteria group bacterium Gr01-1014_20]|nr:MAG: protein-L-isoaspartate(D-aspartate) O-methyltransferase [Parcubacteria group bacterium Gr01-1014_20]
MSKNELIRALVDWGYLKNPLILKAFEEIDRKDFIPKNLEFEAYKNEPVPIGRGQTISQPLTVAFMLELLDPKPGEKILDIGAGSGWQSALLGNIVGEKGKVIAVERILPIKALAEENISKYSFTSRGTVKVIWKNAAGGVPEEAPYDKIIAAASAEAIPEVWKDQLKIGGCIVAPVGGSIVVINKKSEKDFETEEYQGFRFVPLVVDD